MSPHAASADGAVLHHHDRAVYRSMIVASPYPPEVEAAIAVVCDLVRARHDAYRQYLAGTSKVKGGRPGYEAQSPRWREAEAAAFAATRTLAAMLGTLHPSPDGQAPVIETQALLDARIGPLCTGWRTRDTDIVVQHHSDDSCPVHPSEG